MDFFAFEEPKNPVESLAQLRVLFETSTSVLHVSSNAALSLHTQWKRGVEYSLQEQSIAIQRALRLMKSHPHDESVLDDVTKVVSFLSGECTRPQCVVHVEFSDMTRFPQIHLPQFSDADVGFKLWGASLLLSHFLLSCPQHCREQTIVELGAASGLCSLASLHAGASQVFVTDFNQACLRSASATFAPYHSRARVMFLDWTCDPNPNIPWKNALVLGAAVVYEEVHAHQLFSFLQQLKKEKEIRGALIATHLAHLGFSAFARLAQNTASIQVFRMEDEDTSEEVALFHFFI